MALWKAPKRMTGINVDYDTLLFELEGTVGTLTLNVPQKLNAHGKRMREELLHFWRERQNGEETCRVIIMTGAGRAFCAGADIDELGDDRRDIEDIYRATDEMSEVVFLMRRAPQPIIGAIRGWAAGGGFCLALAADVRVVDPTARFLPSFINIGLSGGDMGSTFYLPRQIGLGVAAEYLYTGDFMDADTAARYGLANYVVPPGGLLEKARDLADRMVKKSVLGLRMTKETLNQNIGAASLESSLNLENRNEAICLGSRPTRKP
jgi:enoyl-CoA hydratase